ncbi:MAG TPA: type III polyketide synthase [Ktedonobacterales bacterium]
MSVLPRVVAITSADPEFVFAQEDLIPVAQERILGPAWQGEADNAGRASRIERLFRATRVRSRRSVVDLPAYYSVLRSTGDRMATYAATALPLASNAVSACIEAAGVAYDAERISDVTVVSCTGYQAPGLDILLARDLGMRGDVRRVVIGHMGCYGALVGLRQAYDALRSHPDGAVLLVSVELCGLHFAPSDDAEVITSFALFGDGCVATLLANEPAAAGPALVDTLCVADYASADQMSWTVTDAGFAMGLSPRVPVTLRRQVRAVVTRLLDRHGLATGDVAHWLVHPGGPSILDAVAGRLGLSDEQMALSWEVLAERGNCSSTTVLLMLEKLLSERRPERGEWGVMMAFGPGLTLETALLRF